MSQPPADSVASARGSPRGPQSLSSSAPARGRRSRRCVLGLSVRRHPPPGVRHRRAAACCRTTAGSFRRSGASWPASAASTSSTSCSRRPTVTRSPTTTTRSTTGSTALRQHAGDRPRRQRRGRHDARFRLAGRPPAAAASRRARSAPALARLERRRACGRRSPSVARCWRVPSPEMAAPRPPGSARPVRPACATARRRAGRAQRRRHRGRLRHQRRPAPAGDRAAGAARRTTPTSRARCSAAATHRARRSPRDPAGRRCGDEPLPPLDVEFAGGHRIALETEAVVRRESISNTVGSLALILPLLFLVFRSLWLVAVGSLPSALSLLVVLGVLGFAGATLSAAATASAAMLFGLGVDGVVLLYVALHATRSAKATRAGRGDRGLTGPSYSMLLGMWTTAATFYGLTFVDFPSLQQLGRLIGHSMLLCGILTLVLVPALLPRKRRARRRRVADHAAAGGVGRARTGRILCRGAGRDRACSAAPRPRLRINPTLDRLRSVTLGAVLEEQHRADVRPARRGLRRAREGTRPRAAADRQRAAGRASSRASCPARHAAGRRRCCRPQAAQTRTRRAVRARR